MISLPQVRRKSSLFWRLAIIGSLAAVTVVSLAATASKDAVTHLLGDWTGESTCVNKEQFPACKDEAVVYHIKKVPEKTNTVNLSADKIVNGKPEAMGDFDFVYDARKQTLTTEFKNERVPFTIEFTVRGDVIEGGLYSFPDRVQARRIKVTKNK